MKVRNRTKKRRLRWQEESDIAEQIRRNAGKYVALARDWSRVVGVGKTWMEARDNAIKAGFPDAPVILAARSYDHLIF